MSNSQHILLYHDSWFIAVNKPHNLLCVPGLREKDNLFDRLKLDFPNLRVVHRLDMATSGVVLFARHYEAQKAISKLFEKRIITKDYVALAHGEIEPGAGEIHASLAADWPNRPRQKVDWVAGKQATTFFRVLSSDASRGCTRVSLKPYTGRTHQLRIHMLHLGHPIIGDTLYYKYGSQDAASRLCLHAERLRFQHPSSGEHVTIETPASF